jgi:hypothetical protein
VVRVTRFEGMIAIGGVGEAEVPPRVPSVGPRNVFDRAPIAVVDTRLVVNALYLLIRSGRRNNHTAEHAGRRRANLSAHRERLLTAARHGIVMRGCVALLLSI